MHIPPTPNQNGKNKNTRSNNSNTLTYHISNKRHCPSPDSNNEKNSRKTDPNNSNKHRDAISDNSHNSDKPNQPTVNTNSKSTECEENIKHHRKNNTSQPQQHKFPFNSDYCGAIWNTEGLICAKSQKQQLKRKRLFELCRSHDYVIITETHSTPGKAHAYTTPDNTTTFWSHKDTARAGIGIIINNDFLNKFQNTPTWKVHKEGYVAQLSLSGLAGSLDLWCIYLPTGTQPNIDKEQREHLIQIIAENCRPHTQCLTILGGDWNFAQHEHDRMNIQDGSFTGSKDKNEATHCERQLLDPHKLHELHQEAYTYFHPIACSRLDRIYSNHHPATQLDSKYHCNTLKHHKNLSKHCPVSFGRRYSSKNHQLTNPDDELSQNRYLPIKADIIKHKDWKDRVNAEFHHQMWSEPLANNSIRRLILLKRAMHTVSEHITQEQFNKKENDSTTNETDLQQHLNHTMGFIRAAKQSNLKTMQLHANRYHKIQEHINPEDPLAFTRLEFIELEDHAVELAREIFTNEIQELHQSPLPPNAPAYNNRKQNILTKLKRLQPGSAAGIGAVEDEEGQIHTDTNNIIRTLTEHWSKTFNSTDIDHNLLDQWLDTVTSRTTATGTPPNLVSNQQPDINKDNTKTDYISNRTQPLHNTTTQDAHNNPDNTQLDNDRRCNPTHNPPKPKTIQNEQCTDVGTTQSTKRTHTKDNKDNIPLEQSGPHSIPKTNHPALPFKQHKWRVSNKHIKQAINTSNNSAPGPDGIPFLAWRTLGHLGASTLLDVADTLASSSNIKLLNEAYWDEADEYTHHYNRSTMICLPKKSNGSTQEGTPIYSPANTRPLNIVNTDNRLIASATRCCWEHHLENWVLARQQGFLHKRSIIRNLLEMDMASMHTSLMQDSSACLLMDFASAFPSVSQDFMRRMLQHIGLPPNALHLLDALYNQSHCSIQLNNANGTTFPLLAGVRQGCPLSPLIYAVVAEILLDNIEARCPSTLTRAYADDTALVLEDLWKEGPTLANIFHEFSKISGLHLNIHKCIMIPLFQHDKNQLKHKIQKQIPIWANMNIQLTGKYLGFFVGPNKNNLSWEGPGQKYITRCNMWQDKSLGLHYQATIYNTLALSTLSYIAQLENPPPNITQLENKGLTILAKGPGGIGDRGWATKNDLFRLKEDYGQQTSFKSVQWYTQAAQGRVYTTDPYCATKQFKNHTKHLRDAMRLPNNLPNWRAWQQWYQNSFALNIENTYRDHKTILDHLTLDYNNENTNKRKDPLCASTKHNPKHQHIQKQFYIHLSKQNSTSRILRINHKIQRWQLNNTTKTPLHRKSLTTNSPQQDKLEQSLPH